MIKKRISNRFFAKIAKNSACILSLNGVFYKPEKSYCCYYSDAFNIRVIETKIWENAW